VVLLALWAVTILISLLLPYVLYSREVRELRWELEALKRANESGKRSWTPGAR
jgi:hypothetical protein